MIINFLKLVRLPTIMMKKMILTMILMIMDRIGSNMISANYPQVLHGGDYAPESIVGTVININLNFTKESKNKPRHILKTERYYNGDGIGPIMIM